MLVNNFEFNWNFHECFSQLPGPGRGYHTMDGGVVCGGLNNLRSCINFNVDNGKWANYSAELVYERVEHSSWKR